MIGLFAKQPVPGQVKTRLSPPLSHEQACHLYRQALLESVAQLQQTGISLTICYAGERSWFEQVFQGLPLLAQHGDSLGVRMINAVQELFTGGDGPVLLSGSDNPDLPAALVREVVARLQDTDVVTIPCRDGGYAIVGLRKETTEIFEGIPWSTSGVLAATRKKCLELGLSYHETESWDDIDELADLKRLVERSPQSSTARYVLDELADLLA
jgi:rSAM/selenodomain-associated transferase 1